MAVAGEGNKHTSNIDAFLLLLSKLFLISSEQPALRLKKKKIAATTHLKIGREMFLLIHTLIGGHGHRSETCKNKRLNDAWDMQIHTQNRQRQALDRWESSTVTKESPPRV